MKKNLLRGAAAIAIAAAAGSAFAADLPARGGVVAPPPIITAPLFTWSGFYVGLNAGYHFQDNSASTVGTPGFVALGALVPRSLGVGKDGFIGGGQIGYNQQFGALVAGVEADIQWVDNERRGTAFTSAVPVGGLGFLTTSATSRTEYLGTLRARLGFVPMDRALLYVTGGLAYGNPRNEVGVVGSGAGLPLWAGSSNSTRAGWTVGGGFEYAFTNNITAKLEYLYYDLGRRTVTATPLNAAAAATGVAYVARFENQGHIVRAGVNWKF